MHALGVKPDAVMYRCMLRACGSIGAASDGRSIHSELCCCDNAAAQGSEEEDPDTSEALIDMYARCGALREALAMLRRPQARRPRSIVSWTAIVAACVACGDARLGLELFREMLEEQGIRPDRVLYVSVARACAMGGSIGESRSIHDQMLRDGFSGDDDPLIANTLARMYARCGGLAEACQLLSSMRCRDVASWSILIAAWARHGDSAGARQCLEEMLREGVKPDSTLCVDLFSACTRLGLLAEGCMWFDDLLGAYGHRIPPSLQHWHLMVDLLGRIGHLDDAEDVLRTMSVSPQVGGQTALISSCRRYGNTSMLGNEAATRVS
jgi:pentatricopeptide repeat protein